MSADDGQILSGDLAHELLQSFVLFDPLLYLRHQLCRHIDRAGLPVLLEGQLPGRLTAAWTPDARKCALDEDI